MSNSTNAVATARAPKFSEAMSTEIYKSLVLRTLGDAEVARRFTASIMAAVAINPALQDCTPGSVLAGALVGESLKLSPSPQLGQYYLIPFKCKEKTDEQGHVVEPACVKAQFVLGYKGYIQLALRSGQYRKLNVIELRQGELIDFDPLNEEIKVSIIPDYAKRETTPVVGYYVMFEYVNGFRKSIYWTKDRMLQHANTYSKAFSADAYAKIQRKEIPDKDMWKYSSFWYKDFDDMAKKTLLRHIISRWGIMSIEMQAAFENDDSLNEPDFTNGGVISESERQLESQVVAALAPAASPATVNLDEV